MRKSEGKEKGFRGPNQYNTTIFIEYSMREGGSL
jgi:hypothetical protein